ncbi:mono/diheme cytochrome c family protein [Microvirga lupini]|uniref:Mono/diheme cytochrome c family protein n=1 Tax=Microvirga lupini TaxID=420324 RepID=A0A7W4YWM1_9HYPH|nr:mono/diheme cytochrome c family protein [Microvirga lupini]
MQAGRRLAHEVCAPCHAVEAGQDRSPHRQAPPFEQIARVPGMTTTALTVALRTSHETMPNIMLEPKELRDVTAYITSLRNRPARDQSRVP